METIKVLVPDYYSKFHCIGAECQDSCCANWGNIYIDKETYKKYKNFPSPEFAKKIHTALKPMKNENGKINPEIAAAVVFDKDRKCPFLTEGKLCEIQQKMGENFLSNTCKIYPRYHIRKINTTLEASLTLSCPAVAQFATMRKDRLKFVKIDMDKKNIVAKLPMYIFDLKASPLHAYVVEMRQTCIEMMQNNGLPILQRIYSIAHFLRGIEGIDAEIELGINSKLIAELFKEKAQSFREFIDVINEIIKNAMASGKMVNIREDVEEEKALRLIYDYIIINSRTEWENMLKDKSLMLENYFVNFIFSNVFPFGKKELGIFQHSFLLWERYEMCRYFLGIYAVKNGEIRDEDVLMVIQRVEKYFSHEDSQKVSSRILRLY
jgi:lysine-N-methylase